MWSKSYPGIFFNNLEELTPKLHRTSDGGFVFTNYMYGAPGIMIKTDSSGNVIWSQTLFLAVTDVTESDNGGFIVIGNGPLMGVIMGETLNPCVGIIRTDSLGNSVSCEYPMDVTADSYTVNLSAITFTVTSGSSAIHMDVPVTDVPVNVESGCVPITGAIAENSVVPSTIDIFPNPANGIFTLKVNHAVNAALSSIDVLNYMGQSVYYLSGLTGSETTIDISGISDGMYIAKVSCGQTVDFRKIIKCH